MTRLLLHIGSPKTGSSAIQRVLSLLKDPLLSKGIHLPDANFVIQDSSLNSGNGEWLANYCTGIWPADSAKGQLTLKIFAAQADHRQNSILSSENLYYAMEDALKDVALAARTYEEVGVVLYVRNPVDMCFSLWLQGVKRTFITPISLEDYAEAFFFDPLGVIERFQAVFTNLKIYVRNYDTARTALISDFMDAAQAFFNQDLINLIGSANLSTGVPVSDEIVNRSLYENEVFFMRELTRLLADKHISPESIFEAKRVSSDILLTHNTASRAATCPGHISDTIARRAEPMVRRINDAYGIGLTAQSSSKHATESASEPDAFSLSISRIAAHALARIPPSQPVVHVRQNEPLEFDGYVDHTSSVYVSGWVVCTNYLTSPVLVLVSRGALEVTLVANIYREDVAAAKPGYPPHCGFYYEFDGDASALITQDTPIRVSVLGSGAPLPGSVSPPPLK